MRTRYENETVINFNDEEGTASVFTLNGPLQRRMARLMDGYPDQCRQTKENEWEVPKRWIKVNPPRKMTDEQREAAADRMRSAREQL